MANQSLTQRDVEIRTMASDLELLKTSGGDLSATQFRGIGESRPEISEEAEISPIIPGYSGPEKGIFEPGPISPSPLTPAAARKGGQFKPILKIMFLIAGIFALAAGIGFLTYFLVKNFL